MAKSEFESFLADFLTTPSNISYFWNLVYLATGDLARYSGPKSMDEFLDLVKNRKYYGHADQVRDKKLLDFYTDLKSPDTQKCMTWVKILVPLVARSDQLPGILAKTGIPELDCYNTIVLEHLKLQDIKLQYDLLTRVIDKVKPIADTNRINAEPYKNLYDVARHFRSICDYAVKSDDANIRSILISDKVHYLKYHRTAAGKLQMAQALMGLMIQKLEHAVIIGDATKIRSVCQEAHRYVAHAGAENQGFVNEMWDVFDYNTLESLPRWVYEQNKNR